jgi:hypothetical protein
MQYFQLTIRDYPGFGDFTKRFASLSEAVKWIIADMAEDDAAGPDDYELIEVARVINVRDEWAKMEDK